MLSGALTLMAALVVACDQPVERIGLELTESGGLVIHYLPCRSDTRVSEVSLLDANGTRAGDDDVLLWRITSQDGTLGREFEVGETSEGFELTKTLASPLGPDRLLRVVVASSALPQGESSYARLNQLSVRLLRVEFEDQLFTREEFAARNACD